MPHAIRFLRPMWFGTEDTIFANIFLLHNHKVSDWDKCALFSVSCSFIVCLFNKCPALPRCPQICQLFCSLPCLYSLNSPNQALESVLCLCLFQHLSPHLLSVLHFLIRSPQAPQHLLFLCHNIKHACACMYTHWVFLTPTCTRALSPLLH